MRMNNFVLPMIPVLILLLTYLPMLPATGSPAIGSTTITLDAVADSYVNSSSPETNYGSLDHLCVSTNSEEDLIYLMFDLSSLPPEALIIAAELKLYITDIGGVVGNINAHYCANNSWTQEGITWNNKPDFDSQATHKNYFGMIVWTGYHSWDVTSDVQTALSQGSLSQVILRESSGHATFESLEATHEPRLEVEYSVKPVHLVKLGSAQDMDATANLGFISVSGEVFSLPTELWIVNGSYPVAYSGGYKFLRWETTGGVVVGEETLASTVVTVTGNGTLRAIGSVEELEYAYDHGRAEAEYGTAGEIDAVQFTPLFSGQLLTARLYMYALSSYAPNTFKVHVMDEGRDPLIPSFNVTPSSEGWLDVDLSAYNLNVTQGEDFYLGMEWIEDYNPDLGEDRTNASHRSWHWNGEFWDLNEYSDYMIRAVVGSQMPPPEVEVGVQVGDWMGFGEIYFEYASNMEGYQEPPSRMDVVWASIEVLEVSDSQVTIRSLIIYRNGTQEIQISSGNLATGEGNLTGGIIAANLAAGDQIPGNITWYTQEPLRLVINGTVTRRYAHADREVNYVNLTQPIIYDNTTYGALNLSLYWDRETGLLCEEHMSYRSSYLQNQTRYYLNMSLRWMATATNLWPAVFTAQDGYTHQVAVTSNCTLTDFNFSQALMQLSLNVTGPPDHTGYCNLTIPLDLLKGEPWKVYVNHTDCTASCIITHNSTHTFIYIPYGLSTQRIRIKGTWVVPEFRPSLMIALFLVATLLVAAAYRRETA